VKVGRPPLVVVPTDIEAARVAPADLFIGHTPMSETTHSPEMPTVLVVEDDRDLADTYSIWLESEYDVRTAYSGSDGLTLYDSAVDIVLVDRRVPDISGSDVVQNMAQRGFDDQKAMLTSIEPGRDLVDLPCDEYLTKPVTKTQLRDTVRELQMRSKLDGELQRHFTITTKIAALENSNATGTEAAIDELRRKADRTRARIEGQIEEIEDSEEFDTAFRAIE
jgi:DNA-binding NtrC family response regulator